MVSVEQAHGLAFKHKPEIFLLKTPTKFQRVAGSTVRFKTFPLYGRVFVSPHAMEEADKGLISLPIYLKHELSHSLLFQHMTLYRFFNYPTWLLEGIATQSSGMMGHAWYPDKKATCDLIREGNFLPPRDFGTRNEDTTLLKVPKKAAFLYSEFACIIEDLMDNYGREKVLAYIKALLNESDDIELFQATFGQTFGDYLSSFRRRINQGTQVHPPPIERTMPLGRCWGRNLSPVRIQRSGSANRGAGRSPRRRSPPCPAAGADREQE